MDGYAVFLSQIWRFVLLPDLSLIFRPSLGIALPVQLLNTREAFGHPNAYTFHPSEWGALFPLLCVWVNDTVLELTVSCICVECQLLEQT